MESPLFVYAGAPIPRTRRRRQTIITLYPITYQLHPSADTRQCLTLKDATTVGVAPCDNSAAQNWQLSDTGLAVAVGTSPYRCLTAQDRTNAQLFLATCNPRLAGQSWGVGGSDTPVPAMANQELNVCAKLCDGFPDEICAYKESELPADMCMASNGNTVNRYMEASVIQAGGQWATATDTPSPSPTSSLASVPTVTTTVTATPSSVAPIQTEPLTTTVTEPSDGGTSTAAIVAIVLASVFSVLVIVALILLAWWLLRRKRRSKVAVAAAVAKKGDESPSENSDTVSAFYGAVHRADELSRSVDTNVASIMPLHTLTPSPGQNEEELDGTMDGTVAASAAARMRDRDLMGTPSPEPGYPEVPSRIGVGKTTIVLFCPHALDDEEVVLVGNKPSLGAWQPEDAPRMKRSPEAYTYTITLANVAADPIEFKFAKVSDRLNAITWMGGDCLKLERTDIDITQSYSWTA